MNLADLLTVSQSLEGASPAEVLTWAARQFPSRLTFATGFGVEGCVLIDFISRLQLRIDVFTLDTDLLFPETYELWRKLEERYRIEIRAIRPLLSVQSQAELHGPNLWERSPDRCCEIRKVAPLRSALAGFDAWISAIRREQTPDRAGARVVERDSRFGLIKVNPLVGWSSAEVWSYVRAHGVPYNALHDRGFSSIGCAPCTTPVLTGEDPRAGRWRGRMKTECGLHSRSSIAQDSRPLASKG